MLKKILLIIIFFLFSGCSTVYHPAILKNNFYNSYDISLKWQFKDNILKLKLTNSFWINIFDFEISIRPVNDKLQPIGKPYKKYIGSLDVDESVNITCKIIKNVKLIELNYTYYFPGYRSEYDALNYQTVYLQLSK